MGEENTDLLTSIFNLPDVSSQPIVYLPASNSELGFPIRVPGFPRPITLPLVWQECSLSMDCRTAAAFPYAHGLPP